MHLSMINSVFQSTRRMSKSSKSRSIVTYFDFRVRLKQFGVPIITVKQFECETVVSPI